MVKQNSLQSVLSQLILSIQNNVNSEILEMPLFLFIVLVLVFIIVGGAVEAMYSTEKEKPMNETEYTGEFGKENGQPHHQLLNFQRGFKAHYSNK